MELHFNGKKNRQMKCNSNSTPPRTWSDVELVQFMTDVHKKLLCKLLPSTNSFVISKFNMLRNAVFLEKDQDTNYDYPPRLIK